MTWVEYLVLSIIILYVIGVFAFRIHTRKQNKNNCSKKGGCAGCGYYSICHSNRDLSNDDNTKGSSNTNL